MRLRNHRWDVDVPYWSVEVTYKGKNLVTIEVNCLSGKPSFTPEEESAIRRAAEHLLAFIGPERTAL